jgi:protein-S-isoprenylcysteine O-methyltransferase Ste14
MLAFYRINPYYHSFLSSQTQKTLLVLAIVYSAFALPYYLFYWTPSKGYSKGYIAIMVIGRAFRSIGTFLKHAPTRDWRVLPKLSETERVAILFLLVKAFFLPLMLNFFFDNYHSLISQAHSVGSASAIFSISGFNTFLFPLLFSAILYVDTAFFTFGYIFESGFLHNRVRSVEPTFLGWTVALICYPPFNGLLSGYTKWYANDYAYFHNNKITFAVRILILSLMGIYSFASVNLGTKASNLTNRGIVGWGAYAIVRHPAYVTKNAAWWITIIPVLSLPAVAAMSTWSFIYFLRAVTEERHLSRDPDYRAYCRKVRYRFIPGVI